MIYLLRKPFKGTLAGNTLKHGCGGLNIDACRVGTALRTCKGSGASAQVYSESRSGLRDGRGSQLNFRVEGRWPANFILVCHRDSESCPKVGLDRQSGVLKSGKDINPTKGGVSGFFGCQNLYYAAASNYGDSGGASRFFIQFGVDAK